MGTSSRFQLEEDEGFGRSCHNCCRNLCSWRTSSREGSIVRHMPRNCDTIWRRPATSYWRLKSQQLLIRLWSRIWTLPQCVPTLEHVHLKFVKQSIFTCLCKCLQILNLIHNQFFLCKCLYISNLKFDTQSILYLPLRMLVHLIKFGKQSILFLPLQMLVHLKS